MMSQGSIATPHAFATDNTASFAEVERILTSFYKASLAKELDSREEALRIKVGASTPRPNPWISGSFYLVTAIVLVVLLLAAARLVTWWALPMVILAACWVSQSLGHYSFDTTAASLKKAFARSCWPRFVNYLYCELFSFPSTPEDRKWND